MRFYLGTHQANWLGALQVPLFLSFNRLKERKKFKKALAPWALDSGGFTELSGKGYWSIPMPAYADKAQEIAEKAGMLDFAAVQDWMCEPSVRATTKLSIKDHQRLTCLSYADLKSYAPTMPWMPVLQGWEHDDYLAHVDEWGRWGVDLQKAPIVGLGSVCRRQGTAMAERLVKELNNQGIKMHLFGFKTQGLKRCHTYAKSSDSLAWSFAARRQNVRLDGCAHAKCANCQAWALSWRRTLLEGLT